MTGHALYLRERTQRVIAANADRMSKDALQKMGAVFPITKPAPVLAIRPIFDKGRYIPKSLTDIIATVARLAEISPEAICGMGRRREYVDARSCVANLALRFASHQSELAVDDAMLRGHGMARWYRERHLDRLRLFPSYVELYHRCHAEMAK